MSDPVTDAAAYALTPKAAHDAVREHADLPGKPPATGWSEQALWAAYSYLQERPDGATAGELRTFHIPHGVSSPSSGQFIQSRRWWRDAGDPGIRALPGVERGDDGVYHFVGVDPDEWDMDPGELVPLADARDCRRARVEGVLDVLGVRRRGLDRHAPRAAFVDVVEHVYHREPVPDAHLRGFLENIGLSLADDEHAAVLLELLERDEVVRSRPEDIQIDTYADVLAARDAVAREAVVQWGVGPAVADPATDERALIRGRGEGEVTLSESE